MEEKETPRGCRASKEVNRSLTPKPWLRQWLESDQGVLNQLSRYYSYIENEFLKEREAAPFRDSFDRVALQIVRNSITADLLHIIRPEYHTFIKARSKMPVELPELPPTKTELLLERITHGRAA